MEDAEHELEHFREQWRNEVSTRNKASRRLSAGDLVRIIRQDEQKSFKKPVVPPIAANLLLPDATNLDEYEPRTYHDLENKEDSLKLANEQTRDGSELEKPRSALDHYEKAVERETLGSLGDSVSLYRKAFRVGPLHCMFVLGC